MLTLSPRFRWPLFFKKRLRARTQSSWLSEADCEELADIRRELSRYDAGAAASPEHVLNLALRRLEAELSSTSQAKVVEDLRIEVCYREWRQTVLGHGYDFSEGVRGRGFGSFLLRTAERLSHFI